MQRYRQSASPSKLPHITRTSLIWGWFCVLNGTTYLLNECSMFLCYRRLYGDVSIKTKLYKYLIFTKKHLYIFLSTVIAHRIFSYKVQVTYYITTLITSADILQYYTRFQTHTKYISLPVTITSDTMELWLVVIQLFRKKKLWFCCWLCLLGASHPWHVNTVVHNVSRHSSPRIQVPRHTCVIVAFLNAPLYAIIIT